MDEALDVTERLAGPEMVVALDTSKSLSQGDKAADCAKNKRKGPSDLEEAVKLATVEWQVAYDKLLERYQHVKRRQLTDVEALFDEQARRTKVFDTAAEDFVQELRSTKQQDQDDLLGRVREMEAAYLESQNELVIERAKNLELLQRCENLERCQILDSSELTASDLEHDMLKNLTELTVSKHGKFEIIFSHDGSGFQFKLERNKLSEEVGGKDAVLYRAITPGTFRHIGPDWMHSEIIFDVTQVKDFLQQISAVTNCRDE